MTLEERINANYDILTPTDRQIFKILLSLDPSQPVPTVQDVSKRAHVSTTSVHRAIQKLGYKAYTQFKYSIFPQTKKTLVKTNYKDNLTHSIDETLNYFFETDHSDFYSSLHQARNIYLFGTGNEQQSSLQTFSNHFSYYGISPIFINTLTDLDIYSRKMSGNDVIIFCSLNGSIDNYQQVIKTLKMKNTYIVSITLDVTNPLSQISNHSFYFSSDFHSSTTNLHWPSITLRLLLDAIVYHYFEFTTHQK